VDPLFEKTGTPYQYTYQNPIRYTDPTGMVASPPSTEVTANSDGTYTVVGGNANDGDNGIYVVDDKGKRTGETIGVSLTSHSFFFDDNSPVVGAVINPIDGRGADFLNNEIINNKDLTLDSYMKNATGGKLYDFKRRDDNGNLFSNTDPEYSSVQYHYRGMLFSGVDGFTQGADCGTTTYASARDFGNVAAGYVAGRRGMPWRLARLGFDGLQTIQDDNWKRGWASEAAPTQKAERVGHTAGIREFKEKQVQPAIKSFPSFRY